MKTPNVLLAVGILAVVLVGCANRTIAPRSELPSVSSRTAITTAAPLPGDQIAAHSFIDKEQGWAVGTDGDNGSLVQRTTDGGRTWEVLYADGAGFPLTDVCFTDEIHGWAVSSSGTLVGSIIATVDGGRTWVEQGGAGPLESVDFTDALHGVVRGLDGDSPQRPITLTTNDGGKTWVARNSK